MLTLSIVRHAKSSWGTPSLRDIDRPLNTRGKSQAQKLGTFLSDHELLPDLIICSSAKRARQTLKHLKKKWTTDAEIIVEDQLYLASPGTITTLLEELGNQHDHIMIIGHNPGLHMLAMRLAHHGKADDLDVLMEKYPTATLSVIQSDANKWEDIESGSGELKHFITPKNLATH